MGANNEVPAYLMRVQDSWKPEAPVQAQEAAEIGARSTLHHASRCAD